MAEFRAVFGGAFGASGLRSAAGFALNMLLPPRCLSCGETVARTGGHASAQTGALCAACWPNLHYITPPFCAGCGFPFAYDPGPGVLCGACIRETPPFDRARAVLRYDDASRGLVIAFKHGDRTDASPAYGRWMARAGADLLEQADLVVPVPLHRSRLLKRRYNQSAMLALAIGRESGASVIPDLLVRTRKTPSQTGLGSAQRRRNVRGAFAVRDSRRRLVKGRRVVLVDDVYTTGATVFACARALRRAGAAGVDVVTLARVVRPSV